MVRTYTHHFFTNAILSRNDSTGKLLASVNLCSESGAESEFMEYTGNANFQASGNNVELYSDPYASKAENLYYRRLKNSTSFTIHINYQQNTKEWGVIYLFIKNESDLNTPELMEKYDVRFGEFCNDTLLSDGNGSKRFIPSNIATPYYLKLDIEGEKVKSYISNDGIDWLQVDEYTLQNSSEAKVIGVCFDLQGNEYYDFLFSHYIQLMLNIKSSMPLEYLSSPYKNSRPYGYNPLLNFLPIRQKIIDSQYPSILEFVKSSLGMGKYIELNLDEFYIPQRPYTQKIHFLHPNLVYGYDLEHVYVLGILDGKPSTSKVTFEDFNASFSYFKPSNSVVYEIDYVKSKYTFDIIEFKHSIKAYLASKPDNLQIYNLSHHLNNVDELIFGIAIYDELMTPLGIEVLLQDRRVAYLLYEHKNCMCERLHFLKDRGFVCTKDYQLLVGEMTELKQKANLLLNLILKHMAKPSVQIEEKLKERLLELKLLEGRCYSLLFDILP